MLRNAAAALLALCPTVAFATDAIAPSTIDSLTIGEVFRLPSRILGEDRTILVSIPLQYSRSEKRYPVIYLTDGDTHFFHTRGTVDFLSLNGLMPEAIVVGVANTDRTRDLTPTRASQTGPEAARGAVGMTGGAGKFLDFFAHELIPFVEGRYRTAPYRILAGHSLGGLFALSALTERTEIFDAHIAVSPTLGWDDDFALRQTAKLLEGRKELEKALFVTMANEEAGRPSPTRFDRLRKILKRSKATGFVWDMQLMQDEDHGTVVLPAHTWALRKLFDGWRLPLDPKTRRFTGSLSDLGKHYASLEKRFRIGVLPPEPVLNQIGYQHLLDNDTDGALPFFRYAVELYPRSANVHDSLGEALEKSGERKEALESYERAVEAGTRLKDPSLPAFTANRDRLAAANRK